MAIRPGSRDGDAALGFRSHSGWAMLVAVAGPVGEPAVVLRRRVELSVRTPRQPFHAAEGLIRRSTDEAAALAERAVGEAVAQVRAAGFEPLAGGLLLAAGRSLPGLPEVLESHALIHAAEGELFRDVLRQASLRSALRLVEVKERELGARAVRALRRPASALQQRLAQWGEALGPPWTPGEQILTK